MSFEVVAVFRHGNTVRNPAGGWKMFDARLRNRSLLVRTTASVE